MTEQERPAGWTDQMWRDHRLQKFEAAIAGIMSPLGFGEPVSESRALSGPELHARALLAESDQLDEAKRARLLADAESAPRVTVTDLPGQPPSPQERRRIALGQALQSGTVIARPGDGPPKQDFVLTGPDGSHVLRQAMPQMTVITPENADEVERQFAASRRSWENKLLVGKFGERACRQAGIIP